MTNGIFNRFLSSSDLFGVLITNNYVAGPKTRILLKSSEPKEVVMFGFCTICGFESERGAACSSCFSFHCDKELNFCGGCGKQFE